MDCGPEERPGPSMLEGCGEEKSGRTRGTRRGPLRLRLISGNSRSQSPSYPLPPAGRVGRGARAAVASLLDVYAAL